MFFKYICFSIILFIELFVGEVFNTFRYNSNINNNRKCKVFFELAILFMIIGIIFSIGIWTPEPFAAIFGIFAIIAMVVVTACFFISLSSYTYETQTITISDKLNDNIVVAHGVLENCNNDVSYTVIKSVDYSHLKINGTYSVMVGRNEDMKNLIGRSFGPIYIGSINTNCEDKQACVI